MRAYNAVEEEILAEVRQLARDMVWFDRRMAEEQSRVKHTHHSDKLVEALMIDRELAATRRGELMRELWAAREVQMFP